MKPIHVCFALASAAAILVSAFSPEDLAIDDECAFGADTEECEVGLRQLRGDVLEAQTDGPPEPAQTDDETPEGPTQEDGDEGEKTFVSVDTDKDGEIQLAELLAYFSEDTNHERVDSLLQVHDRDGSKALNREEFFKALDTLDWYHSHYHSHSYHTHYGGYGGGGYHYHSHHYHSHGWGWR